MYKENKMHSIRAREQTAAFTAALSTDGRYLAATADSGTGSALYWVDLGAPLATVPLPAAAWLFLSGLLGLAGLARRREVRA